MSESSEAHIVLEERLCAYLQSLQIANNPLGGNPLGTNPFDGYPVYKGHSDQDLDNVATWISVIGERSDTQRYWQGGIEEIELKIMVQTQADDQPPGTAATPLEVHNTAVAGMRAVLDLRNLAELLAAVNAGGGFALSGMMAGAPPIEDGFDTKGRRRQCLFRMKAVGGIQVA